MKKILICAMIAASMLVSGCGSDEPGNNGGGGGGSSKKVKSITKNYKLTVSDDLLKLSKVNVKYIDENNNVATEKVMSTTWSKSVDVNLSRATSDVTAGMSVDCDNNNTANNGTTYRIGYTEDINYTIVYQDGTSVTIPAFNINPQQPQVDGQEVAETIDATENSSAVASNLVVGQDAAVRPSVSDYWGTDNDDNPTTGQGYYIDNDGEVAVDLGFGDILWATRNVGARGASDVGGLYGWGDPFGRLIETRTDYYPARNPNMVLTGNTLSGTRMDIATAQWGNSWRMPRSSEWEMLKANCTITPYTLDGQKGVLVKSNINNNQIFLPANGDRFNDQHRYNSAAPDGYYWSGDWCASTDPSRAWSVYFSSSANFYAKRSYERYHGCSVRPVRPKSVPLNEYNPIVIN
ncbi:MAG: hypothetical protein II752_08395 [Muribaculaceae bacterium]|nr:hypothetical protein [Muribaculaceae bacterium]